MKLILTTDDGTVIDDVENVEEYNLDHAYARSLLIEEINSMLRTAHKEGHI
jgi:hypothetical protein